MQSAAENLARLDRKAQVARRQYDRRVGLAEPPRIETRPEDVPGILDRALAGERLSIEEGVTLLRHADLSDLGFVAGELTRRRHPDGTVTFVVDRNINYSNVCVVDCGFCAFYRYESDPDAYVLSHDEILAKVGELVAQGGTQVLMQGGHHPKLPFEWYLELCRKIKAAYPQVNLHSFSPSEVRHFSRVFKRPVRDILAELKEAGLGSLPGAGAEILVERVRKIIAPRKDSWQDWIETYHIAHELGLKGSATMMFGHVETLEERVLHLERLRQCQDATRDEHGEGVFVGYACWTFQPERTPLHRAGLAAGMGATSYDYLRTLAVSRIYLDNFANIQASWVTQGPKVGQISLSCGCNDFGGTMMEENVVSAAGTTFRCTPADAVRLIRAAGYRPAKRDTHYRILERYD